MFYLDGKFIRERNIIVKIQHLNEEEKSLVEVKVDLSKCNGDSICVDVCPVAVFELQELPEHPGEKKSVVVDNDACIVCRACEVQCPTQAITVTE